MARVDSDDREPTGDRDGAGEGERWALVREQRRPKYLNEDAADGVWRVTVAVDRRGAKTRVTGGAL